MFRNFEDAGKLPSVIADIYVIDFFDATPFCAVAHHGCIGRVVNVVII